MIDSEKARDLLYDLGVEVVSESSGELQALCPMHEQRTGKPDQTPSWWFNMTTGSHFCFSCGYKGGALDLVIDLRDMTGNWGTRDYDGAREWMESYEPDLRDRIARLRTEAPGESAPERVAMTEARLAVYDPPPAWAVAARNLTPEACAHYGVLWDPAEDTWILPLRDPETVKLLGFQLKGEGHRLFKNQPPGIKKSTTLFGIDRFEGGQMVLVESPLDAVRLRAAGVPGGVASCGAAVSARQLDLMTQRATSLVVALDNPQIDAAGAESLKDVYEASVKRGFDFKAFSYGNSGVKDIGDMDDRQIGEGLANAVHSIRRLGELLKA